MGTATGSWLPAAPTPRTPSSPDDTASPQDSNPNGSGSPDPATGPASELQVHDASATLTGDRTFEVSFSYDGADGTESCTVTVDAADTPAACSAGTGSAEVSVDGYNTSYTFTVRVEGGSGGASADTMGTSGAKPLTVDGSAERWASSCYYPSHGTSRPVMPEPGKCSDTGSDHFVRMAPHGSTEGVLCWRQDVSIRDQQLNSSDIWLQVDDGWMSALYFSDWATADANLPPC